MVKEADWKPLESKASKYFKEKQPFERLHVSIPDLKEMFGYSKYKMYYIENLLPPDGSTVYKCGTLVDLCLGPHIQNTGKIKAFQIMKVYKPCSLSKIIDANASRIPHATSGEIKMMIRCKESMALPSLIRSNWQSIKSSSKKQPNEIIADLVLNRSYFSLTSCLPVTFSSSHTELLSSMPSKSYCGLNTKNEGTKKCRPPTCTTSNFGKHLGIGNTIRTTCLVSI